MPKPHVARRLLDADFVDTHSIDSDDYQEFESYQSQQTKGDGAKDSHAPHAGTAAAGQS